MSTEINEAEFFAWLDVVTRCTRHSPPDPQNCDDCWLDSPYSHLVEPFLEKLDERLLDLATDPTCPYFPIADYEQWQRTRSLGHCSRNHFVRGVVAAAWQDVARTAQDPLGIQATVLNYTRG